MASKRSRSPELIANPFIKKKNLGWTLKPPPEHGADTPSSSLVNAASSSDPPSSAPPRQPTSAAIESGNVHVTDHLAHFVTHLSHHTLQQHSPSPRLLPISSWASLYRSCAGSPDGAHFVIHQHDHPVAGTHYDLRLQINETSSVSWAIMYGLPGDPNSIRLMRNATETRIHCLWNHLVETASVHTGSLLIWDTGTYRILPRHSKHAPKTDPSSPPSSPQPVSPVSQQALLHAAFQKRKIRLQLHGTKLPEPYIINLRLTKSEDASGRAKSSSAPQRRRRPGRRTQQPLADPDSGPDSEVDDEDDAHLVPSDVVAPGTELAISTTEREIRELEDEEVRRTNTYPGASNTIGSVHQRKWFLSLDRLACGFVQQKQQGRSLWEIPSRDNHGTLARRAHEAASTNSSHGRMSYPFYVHGADKETSVVTGRKGDDVLRDEKVTGFTPRKGWTPILK